MLGTIYDQSTESEYGDRIYIHPDDVEFAKGLVEDLIKAALNSDIDNIEDSIDSLAKYFDVLDDYPTIKKHGNTYLDINLSKQKH